MPIELSTDDQAQALASIQRFLADEFDVKAGDLKARMLLDFFLKEIGPSIYNSALADSQVYLRERLEDLEGALGKEEFGYWPRSVRRATR
jgi:uncharacterized protein (DUF2164 family)